MNIPFSPPDITEAEIQEVCDALRSGWITTGGRTKKFEERIAAYTGAARCVCLNSATAAMEMTLRVLGVGPGDEVITSAYTYTATASVIAHVGAKIVLVDTQADSFEMDYEALADAVTERTKVIIPVDLGGKVCDYDKIFAIAEEKKHLWHPSTELQKAFDRVIIAADGAHAFGAQRDGKMAGNIADFTSFSFHAVKNLTTGEGGAVTWLQREGIDNDALYKEYMLASLHGQSKDAFSKNQLGAWEYDILYPAFKCNMTDIQAAIGLVQLDRYPGLLARRKEIIEAYDAAFLPMGLKSLPHFADGVSSGHLYLLRVPGIGEQERNEIIRKMAERGVATNVHYKPLPLLTAYKDLGFDIADYPHAYGLYKEEVTLPLYSRLSDEEVQYVISSMQAVVSEVTGR